MWLSVLDDACWGESYKLKDALIMYSSADEPEERTGMKLELLYGQVYDLPYGYGDDPQFSYPSFSGLHTIRRFDEDLDNEESG